jgi:transcriptional regulator with XRE-family HTH domain
LASALHDLRTASGLSGDRLARRCGMSQSKVSRIETGRLLPSVVDVEQVLTALEVDDATRHELLALARVANAEYQDVRASVRRGLHHRQREIAALEASATQVQHFLPALITGLLQIPEYMRAAMSTPIEPAAGDVSRAIALKLERQAVLHDNMIVGVAVAGIQGSGRPADEDGIGSETCGAVQAVRPTTAGPPWQRSERAGARRWPR